MLDSLIYIEKYDKESGYFLADFLTGKGYWSFCQQLYKPGDIEYKDERTMIEIGELRCEQRHPYEGCIYELPHEFLKVEREGRLTKRPSPCKRRLMEGISNLEAK